MPNGISSQAQSEGAPQLFLAPLIPSVYKGGVGLKLRLRVAERVSAYLDARKDLTQAKFAELCGLKQPDISRIVRSGPSDPDVLDNLANGIGRPVEDLVTLRDVTWPVAGAGETPAQKGTAALASTAGVVDTDANLAGPTPRKDATVLQSVPLSPAHLTLYGLIGTLSVEEALKIRLQLMQLVDRTQRHPKKPEKK
jgi:predicted XRE-type DNA-binding protein